MNRTIKAPTKPELEAALALRLREGAKQIGTIRQNRSEEWEVDIDIPIGGIGFQRPPGPPHDPTSGIPDIYGKPNK
jgi:hypothetical protein